MALLDQIISAESGGNPYNANRRSSALGLGQFIGSTWLDMIHRYRPDLEQGRTRQDILALRTNPLISRQMTAAYANENGQKLTAAGFEASPGNTYLAHFAGPAGAINVLRADPGAPLAPILGDQAIAANPFLRNMTAGDLRSWAARKMGAPTPPASIPQQPVQPEMSPQLASQPYASPRPMLNAAGYETGQPTPGAPSFPSGSMASAAPQQPPPDRLAAAALGVNQLPQWWYDRQNTMGG